MFVIFQQLLLSTPIQICISHICILFCLAEEASQDGVLLHKVQVLDKNREVLLVNQGRRFFVLVLLSFEAKPVVGSQIRSGCVFEDDHLCEGLVNDSRTVIDNMALFHRIARAPSTLHRLPLVLLKRVLVQDAEVVLTVNSAICNALQEVIFVYLPHFRGRL